MNGTVARRSIENRRELSSKKGHSRKNSTVARVDKRSRAEFHSCGRKKIFPTAKRFLREETHADILPTKIKTDLGIAIRGAVASNNEEEFLGEAKEVESKQRQRCRSGERAGERKGDKSMADGRVGSGI